MIQFNAPKLKYGNNPPAIYKLQFDTGHFYIGSSKHLKTRISTWKTSLNRKVVANRVIVDVLKMTTSVTLQIIEFVNEEDRLQKETCYIQQFKENKLLLNRSTDAVTNGKMRELPEHLKKPKKVYIPKPYKRPVNFKKVYQYTMNGDFVMTFTSIAFACRYIGVCDSTMEGHLKGKFILKGVKGFIFRTTKMSKDEILKLIRVRKPYQKVLVKKKSPPHYKIIIDLNTGIFYNSHELSFILNTTPKYINRILSEEKKPNTTQYRYA